MIKEEDRINSVEEFFSDDIKFVTYLFTTDIDIELFQRLRNTDYSGMTYIKDDQHKLWIPIYGRPEEFIIETDGESKLHEKAYLPLGDEDIYFNLTVDLEKDIKENKIYKAEQVDDPLNQTITFAPNVIESIL